MTDVTKFISGCMASLSAMVQLELPHVNILSKMDLVTNKRDIEEWASYTLHYILLLDVVLFYFLFLIFMSFLYFCSQLLESGASVFTVRAESTHGSSVWQAKQSFDRIGELLSYSNSNTPFLLSIETSPLWKWCHIFIHFYSCIKWRDDLVSIYFPFILWRIFFYMQTMSKMPLDSVQRNPSIGLRDKHNWNIFSLQLIMMWLKNPKGHNS